MQVGKPKAMGVFAGKEFSRNRVVVIMMMMMIINGPGYLNLFRTWSVVSPNHNEQHGQLNNASEWKRMP